MPKRVLVPLLIGLLAAGQVVVGLVGASGIRSDQRAAAAAAQERRAVAAYRTALAPLVVAVFDVVQPLQDVDDAFVKVRPGLLTARADVLAHSGASAALTDLLDRLAGVPAPRTLRTPVADLTAQLTSLGTAAAALEKAAQAKVDVHSLSSGYDAPFQQLVSAESGWSTALESLYGHPSALPAPSAGRLASHGRRAPTRGGFISASDLVCSQANAAFDDLPSLPELDELRVNFPKGARIIRTALRSLLTVPAPASLAAGEHQLVQALHATSAVPDSMDAIATAVQHSDVAALRRAQRIYAASLVPSQTASDAYRSAGVSVCARFFDVSDLVGSTPAPGTGLTA